MQVSANGELGSASERWPHRQIMTTKINELREKPETVRSLQFALCNVHYGFLETGVWSLKLGASSLHFGCRMLAIADAHGAMPSPDSRKPKILIYDRGINCI